MRLDGWKAVLLGVALCGLAACSGDDGSDGVAASALITLDGGGGTLVQSGTSPAGPPRFDLVLGDLGDVVAFADRPVRDASVVDLESFVDDWNALGWNDTPLAALLTVRDDEGGTWVEAFALSRPRLERGEIHFVADALDEVTTTPASFLDADVFLVPPGQSVEGTRVFSLPGRAGTFVRNPALQAGASPSWTLSIDEVSPVTAYLWTGTPPEAGPLGTGEFLSSWSSFGFDDVPPNASLTVRGGGETRVAVLELSAPAYDAEAQTLLFTATEVADAETLPSSFSDSDLFIDSTGTAANRSAAFTKLIGIDYDPEARCSDDNWTTTNPAPCNPQPSFSCGGDGLAFCPARCQACFDSDITFMKGLGIGAITLYQPNDYALKAAQAQGLKVLLGTFNDTVAGLAKPDAKSGCTYSSFPTACGATYANYLIDGACGSTSPWDPLKFCGDGQTFYASWKPYLDDGTVIGIQIGNELLANGFTKEQILAAAQTLRGVLDSRGYTADKIPVVVSLVLGHESQFCSGGAPPANVDFIAAHPYCSNVAGLPPSWPASGTACLDQVKRDFVNISQKDCGAATTFIGETGFNTGCPGVHGASYYADATTFTDGVTKWACEQSVGLFHFAFVDACPQGGCLAGCPQEPQEGNGYFGLYYTESYNTKGSLVPKLSPMPSLVCP